MRAPTSSPSRKSAAREEKEPRLPIRPGDVVNDKYVVEGVIGTGGVGVIVSARHTKLDERVAIKFLQSFAMQNAETVSRFEREAKALARIKSEHVARVMDFGALPSGAPFLVLEHLDGLDLAELIRRDTRVDIATAVNFVVQACEAVAEAHSLGIVHRDLKPANLFLTKRADGTATIKVLDFGISKLVAKEGDRRSLTGIQPDLIMTQASSIIGSPLYMSPEQMQSPHDVDELSDVWSLGTILYELIVGSAPFEAATMPALCARICTGSPTPLRDRLPPEMVIPPHLDAAIMRCLERDRTKRWGSVAELAERIAMYGSPDNTLSAHRAMRMTVNAGLPFRAEFASDSVEPSSEELDRMSDQGSPHSANRPVSFVPKAFRNGLFEATLHRALGRTRLYAGALAVLFVGTLIGAWAMKPSARLSGFIAGGPAVVVAREAETLELSKSKTRALEASLASCAEYRAETSAHGEPPGSSDVTLLGAPDASAAPEKKIDLPAVSPPPVVKASAMASAKPRAEDVLRER